MKRLNSVLIVDDDSISNFITANVIRSTGAAAHTVTVKDGLKALEYLKYQCTEMEEFGCPDLIVLDMNMPMMDGEEFVTSYNKMKLPRRTPIIVLSSIPVREETKNKLQKSGTFSFLEKPLTSEKINKLLEGDCE